MFDCLLICREVSKVKKILLGLGVLIAVLSIPGNVLAQETVSSFTKNSRAEGFIGMKGRYLQDGSTVIGNAGVGKIVAGGDTVAQMVVDKVQVAVIVEQYNNGAWSQVYSWRESAVNAYTVSTSKNLTVPRGYYYRARGIHSANTDIANSFTDGIWIG